MKRQTDKQLWAPSSPSPSLPPPTRICNGKVVGVVALQYSKLRRGLQMVFLFLPKTEIQANFCSIKSSNYMDGYLFSFFPPPLATFCALLGYQNNLRTLESGSN